MQKQYNNPMIPKAYDVLKTLSADEKIRHRAMMREQSIVNQAIFLAGERKKGKKEQAESTARKMLAKGMDIEEIIELTELDINEIEKLNQELQDKK